TACEKISAGNPSLILSWASSASTLLAKSGGQTLSCAPPTPSGLAQLMPPVIIEPFSVIPGRVSRLLRVGFDESVLLPSPESLVMETKIWCRHSSPPSETPLSVPRIRWQDRFFGTSSKLRIARIPLPFPPRMHSTFSAIHRAAAPGTWKERRTECEN